MNNAQNLQILVSPQRLDSQSVNPSFPYALVAVVASTLMLCLLRKCRKVRKKKGIQKE